MLNSYLEAPGKTPLLFIYVVGRIQSLAVGGLMSPFPCWLLSAPQGPSQVPYTWPPEMVHNMDVSFCQASHSLSLSSSTSQRALPVFKRLT